MDDKKKCPNCREEISQAGYEMHVARCSRYTKYCEDCEEAMPKGEWESHVEKCRTPKPCPQCGKSIYPREVQEHEEVCPEGMVPCKYCELDFSRKVYSEHVEACGGRTDVCELCLQRVRLKDMQEHRDMKCGHLKSEPALDPYTLAGLDSFDPYTSSHSHTPAHYHPIDPPGSEDALDQQWVESVSGTCSGNLDSVLAQNMFYYQATRPEPHPPPVTTTPPDSNRDVELAQRLQEAEIRQQRTSYAQPRSPPPIPATPPDADEDMELARRLQEEEIRRDRVYEIDQNLAQQIQIQDGEYSHSHDPHTSQPTTSYYPRPHTPSPPPSSVFYNHTPTPPPADMEVDAQLAQRLQEEEVKRDRQFERDQQLARQLQNEAPSHPHTPHSSHPHTLHSNAPNSSHPHASHFPHADTSYSSYDDDSHPSHPYASRPHAPHSSHPHASHSYGNGVAVMESIMDEDEELARRLQMEEDKQQYVGGANMATDLHNLGHSYTRPTSPSPPPVDTLLPCQFCDESFPPQQLTQHQNKCDVRNGRGLVGSNHIGVGLPTHHPPPPRNLVHSHAHFRPTQPTELLPCQFCNESFPRLQLTLHQNSCGMRNGHGRAEESHTNGGAMERDYVTRRRGFVDDHPTVEKAERGCVYCGEVVPEAGFRVHRVLCTKNPDAGLSRAYRGSHSPPHTLSPHTPSPPPHSLPETVDIPCEVCKELFPISEIHRHEIACRVKKSLVRKPPSAIDTAQLTRPSLHSTSLAAKSSSHSSSLAAKSSSRSSSLAAKSSSHSSSLAARPPPHSVDRKSQRKPPPRTKKTARSKVNMACRFPEKTSEESSLSVNGKAIPTRRSNGHM